MAFIPKTEVNIRAVRRALGSLIVTLLSILVLLAAPGRPATAHAFLIRTSPQPGSRLDRSPDQIALEFSENIEGIPTFALRMFDGAAVPVGQVQTDATGQHAAASLPVLATGVYRVTWRVLATDGHESEGEFAFGVGVVANTPTSSSQRSQLSWPNVLIAIALLGGLGVAIGGILSERLIWPPGEHDYPRAPIVGALLVASVAGVGAIIVRAAEVQSLTGSSGRLALLTALATAIAALLSHQRRSMLVLATSTAALVFAVLGGHAGQGAAWVTGTATLAHVVLALVWVGALVHLVLVLHSRPAGPDESNTHEPVIVRYERFAVVSVLGAIALGVVVTLGRVHSLRDLSGSRYGQILLIKGTLVLVVLGTAVLGRRLARRNDERRLGWLRRLTRIELSVVAAVVVVSALLANTAPPAPLVGIVLGPTPLVPPVVRVASLNGNNMLLLSATSLGLQATVFSPGSRPAEGAPITITGTQPNRTEITFYPRSCGAGCETIAHDWMAGTTELAVTVADGTYRGGTSNLAITWPPKPDAIQLLADIVATMRSVPSVAISESTTSDSNRVGEPGTLQIDGAGFMSAEPYAGGADDVTQTDGSDGLTVVSFYVPGSTIWGRVWVDSSRRIQREVLIDPGHRIERTMTYP